MVEVTLTLGRAPASVIVAAELTGVVDMVGTVTSDGPKLGLVVEGTVGMEVGASSRTGPAFRTGGGSCQIELTDACGADVCGADVCGADVRGTETGGTEPIDSRGAAGPVASTVGDIVTVGLTKDEVAIAARACLVN